MTEPVNESQDDHLPPAESPAEPPVALSGESQAGESQIGGNQTGENQTGESQAEESRAEDSWAEDSQAGERQPGERQTGKSPSQALMRRAMGRLDQMRQVAQTAPLPSFGRLSAKSIGKSVAESMGQSVGAVVERWFSISETQIAEILQTVRSELPTTEALLIGKPQAGKSSIVRGLTGVSAEIVGQGFRPHTQHTQRYAYPDTELPLLIFTDTVGLGDVSRDTQVILQELQTELQQETRAARVLILTVKLTDFAVDALRQIAQQLRQQYPHLPCLLAVTCLHELYPANADHPPYPPQAHFAEVERAFAEQQRTFAGLYDRAVLLDFTLETDGYDPVFYGLEALRDQLAELLPAAEAAAIHRLLGSGAAEAGRQLGNLYRDVGRHYISAFAIMAAGLAAVPLPLATMPVLTALQVSMVVLLGKLYGQTLTPSQAAGLVSAIAGGFLAQAIGRELIKFLPGLGSVIAASWAGAYTWALGEAACVYFGDLLGGKTPDAQRIQAVMREAFEAGKRRFRRDGG